MNLDHINANDPIKYRFTEGDGSMLAALIETSDDAILSLTPDGKIVTFNGAAEAMFDYSREEILGKSAFQLVPLGRGGDLQENLKRIRQGKIVEHFETVRMKKDGSRFNVSLRISAIKDITGKLIGISWILRDITAQKEAEALIRKLSSVVEQTADTVMITDKAGTVEYVNPAFISTTGYSKEEAVGHSSKLLKSGKHSRLFYKKLWETILSGNPFQASMINRKKSGDLFHTEKTITPLKDNSGAITHFVSTDKDITDRRLAEQHSQQVQRRFTELFNYSPDPMAYYSLDGTVIEANDAFSTLTGYTKDELINRKKYQDITAPKYWGHASKTLERMLSKGEPCAYEKEYTKKDGTLVPALVTAFPVKSGDGKHIDAIGMVVKDITQLKKQQKRLEATALELGRSNRDLEQFASIASHDLQEPLRTMTSFLQMIDRINHDRLDGESREYLNFVVDGSKRLRALIDDLLAYSRIGSKRLEFAEFESKQAVDVALSNLSEAIGAAQAQVEIRNLPNICADSAKLTQLFQNLIVNAIKYQSERSPVIQISAEKSPGGWTFKVADNGIGIPSDSTERVFEMFKRLPGRSEIPGTGIGLAICRKIVEQLGGKIWVESEVGKGSTFFFSVPDDLSRE